MTKEGIEDCFDIIEEVAEQLEDGDLSLDDSFKQYEKGIKYIDSARKQLDEYSAKFEKLNTSK